ncbi:hypothetical protein LXL04_036044 [Taraxacum kok-saghyz]
MHPYLNNNYLTGGIPAQLANLTNLEILYLSYNKMSGIVPAGLAHIPKLTYLYLDHIQLSGRIPEAFYKHPYLKELYIEGNAFRPGVNPLGIHKIPFLDRTKESGVCTFSLLTSTPTILNLHQLGSSSEAGLDKQV